MEAKNVMSSLSVNSAPAYLPSMELSIAGRPGWQPAAARGAARVPPRRDEADSGSIPAVSRRGLLSGRNCEHVLVAQLLSRSH